MNNRNYNIYFHTHTISGIIISALLYVIFFAGSFAFFKHEISAWQKNTPHPAAARYDIDFNTIADSLDKQYGLYGRNVSFYVYPHRAPLGISVSPSKDTLNKKPGGFFYLDTKNFTKSEYKDSYDLGEFLYRLHFLAPVNSIAKFGFPLGYYIAGSIAFIFLFALITGLLLHWNKIVSNFYLFRPWEKLKTVWTDLHTALGVISFPFLLVFAVTGSYFLISYPLFTKPTVTFQYGGKEDSLNKTLGYRETDVAFQNKQLTAKTDINYFLGTTQSKWKNTRLSQVQIANYGDQSMQVSVSAELPQRQKMTGEGKIVYEAGSKSILESQSPFEEAGYTKTAQTLVYSLHFGNYGGFALKILYFLLGICGCVVIISGVLIWFTARNKKNIPEKKRIFNTWLTYIYLSICLSMFPVTAATFIAVKINPNGGMAFIYPFFFWTWLAVTVLLISRRNNYKTNRDCMLAGSVIGFCIPVVNGIVSKTWFWDNYRLGHHDVLWVDIFWILLSLTTLICWRLIILKHNRQVTA